MTAPDELYTADVCVIGSGLAGAIVARECIESGRDVVMIEAGPAWRRRVHTRLIERQSRSNSLRMRLWLRNSRYDRTMHQVVGDPPYPISTAALIARGGASLAWSGFAYRMQPEDFALRELTGQGEDWPISYADLERYYRRAEQTLRVQGDHKDPGHPPRSGPFPIAPRPYEPRDAPFMQLVGPESVMHHNWAVSADGLPLAADQILDGLERRRLRLLSRCVAHRLVLDGAQRCVAVEARTGGGRSVRIEANAVVVCGGGLESPKLLAASRTSAHPTGLGNQGGQLGHNLVSHTGINIGGPLPGGLGEGPPVLTAASRRWDSVAEQRDGKFLVLWRPRLGTGLVLNGVLEQHPQHGNRVELSKGVDHLGLPRTVLHYSHDSAHVRRIAAVAELLRTMMRREGLNVTIDDTYIHAHPMCTTRMSHNPEKGVVDRDLRVHGTENVFVCGSSSFTTGAAAHPTLTIAALAHRLGALLADGST
jgi:choline dehydrogenase-like flavoprotein